MIDRRRIIIWLAPTAGQKEASMWMSNCLVVVNRLNSDANSLSEIASALREFATVIAIDEKEHVIEVSMPSHEQATAAAIEGVSYIRCVFSYFCEESPVKAA
jgi:hypothetical protein